MPYCLNTYAPDVPESPVCELPAGHAGVHEQVDADGDTWAWDDAAPMLDPGRTRRDADAMVLDVFAHADVAVRDFRVRRAQAALAATAQACRWGTLAPEGVVDERETGWTGR
jgi:hypothetical protein